MANEQNLRPKRYTSEEAKINGKKGGIASGKAKREKKLLRELLEEALAMQTPQGTNRYVDITQAIINKASNGDTKAYEVIRDTLGQKPVEEVKTEIVSSIKVELTDD